MGRPAGTAWKRARVERHRQADGTRCGAGEDAVSGRAQLSAATVGDRRADLRRPNAGPARRESRQHRMGARADGGGRALADQRNAASLSIPIHRALQSKKARAQSVITPSPPRRVGAERGHRCQDLRTRVARGQTRAGQGKACATRAARRPRSSTTRQQWPRSCGRGRPRPPRCRPAAARGPATRGHRRDWRTPTGRASTSRRR